jgi:hypothetical protein
LLTKPGNRRLLRKRGFELENSIKMKVEEVRFE